MSQPTSTLPSLLNRPVTPLSVCVLTVALSVLTFAYLFYDDFSSKQAARWPSVQGKIIRSEVLERTGWRHQISYLGKVEYSYNLNGQTYRNDRVGWSADFLSDPSQLTAPYKVGNNVVVFYNPSNSQESVLNPTLNTLTEVRRHALSILFPFGLYIVLALVWFAQISRKTDKWKILSQFYPATSSVDNALLQTCVFGDHPLQDWELNPTRLTASQGLLMVATNAAPGTAGRRALLASRPCFIKADTEGIYIASDFGAAKIPWASINNAEPKLNFYVLHIDINKDLAVPESTLNGFEQYLNIHN